MCVGLWNEQHINMCLKNALMNNCLIIYRWNRKKPMKQCAEYRRKPVGCVKEWHWNFFHIRNECIDWRMKFHSVHGKSVTLTEVKSVASRSELSFCHGIVFSDQPLKVTQKVSFEVKTTDAWSGGIRIGVTSVDPGKLSSSDLPKYAIPSLSKREGFWVCPVSEGIISSGCKVTLYINNKGQLQFFVNDVYKGACLKGLPTGKPLWLCLDLYGNTKSAKFVKAGKWVWNVEFIGIRVWLQCTSLMWGYWFRCLWSGLMYKSMLMDWHHLPVYLSLQLFNVCPLSKRYIFLKSFSLEMHK